MDRTIRGKDYCITIYNNNKKENIDKITYNFFTCGEFRGYLFINSKVVGNFFANDLQTIFGIFSHLNLKNSKGLIA